MINKVYNVQQKYGKFSLPPRGEGTKEHPRASSSFLFASAPESPFDSYRNRRSIVAEYANVLPHRFVDEAVAHNAQVIGISSMMVHSANGEKGCLKVRQILKERDLEDRIKIIVGGAPYRYDPHMYKVVQADAWSSNGIEAGEVITNLIGEVKRR